MPNSHLSASYPSYERRIGQFLVPWGCRATLGLNNHAPFTRFATETSLAGCSKRTQRRGARQIDERRRTYAVRWSEAIEQRNEACEAFSAAC